MLFPPEIHTVISGGGAVKVDFLNWWDVCSRHRMP